MTAPKRMTTAEVANAIKKIESAKTSDFVKITRFYALVMLNYRQPLGDAAWSAMIRITGPEYANALAWLMGLTVGTTGHLPGRERWEELLNVAPVRPLKKLEKKVPAPK